MQGDQDSFFQSLQRGPLDNIGSVELVGGERQLGGEWQEELIRDNVPKCYKSFKIPVERVAFSDCCCISSQHLELEKFAGNEICTSSQIHHR
jgi:hypothetical protein